MSTDVQISGDRKFQLQSGISLAQAGKLEDAAAKFNALLAKNNRDIDALNNLAIVYRLEGKSHDALGALLEAIDIDPTRAEFQYNLGKVYKQLGNFKSAAMAYAKAVENESSFVPAYINLGATYYLLHEFGRAVNFFKRGLDRYPANEILRANYKTALATKQAAETAGVSSADLPQVEIFEADDVFMGAPVPADTVNAAADAVETANAAVAESPDDTASAAALPETASSYTLDGIRGLLRYLMELADFFPVSSRQVFREQGIEQSIKNISNALSSLEENAPQAIPKIEPAAKPKPDDVSAPEEDDVSIILPAGITGMLNHLEKLAQYLPPTKQRDILKQKMENLIEGLNAAALGR